jgi:hypothetical protein
MRVCLGTSKPLLSHKFLVSASLKAIGTSLGFIVTVIRLAATINHFQKDLYEVFFKNKNEKNIYKK